MPMEAAHILGNGDGDTQVRVEFLIGGQSNKVQAEQEAREFESPRVFTNRSAIFPNPINFGLALTVVSVTAHQWERPPSPFNQFYIKLVLDATGPDAGRIEEWVRRVDQAVKVFAPGAYGATTDRAKHLQDTGRDNPVTQGVASHQSTYTGAGGDREAHLRERHIASPVKEGAKAPEQVHIAVGNIEPIKIGTIHVDESTISRHTLEGMDEAYDNFLQGNVGVPITAEADPVPTGEPNTQVPVPSEEPKGVTVLGGADEAHVV